MILEKMQDLPADQIEKALEKYMEDHELPFDVYCSFKDAVRLKKRFKMPTEAEISQPLEEI